MRNIVKLGIAAAIAVTASTAAAAQAVVKSESCSDAYGYYGYSAAYCAHDPYGRSSPPDRYYGQDSKISSQGQPELARQADRDQYSYLYGGYAVRDGDHRPYPDSAPYRDRG